MAIYHLSVKPVSRGVGRSATAAAAYRAAERIEDLTSGEVFDYTRKGGVEHTEIVLPTAVAKRDINWARDRQQLWNAAEAAEKRKDARVAREYEVALPHELTRAQRQVLVRAFGQELANRYGVAVDFAIHAPHRAGDDRNHHAHILTTTRTVTATGLGAKTEIELGDRDRARLGLGPGKDEITAIRERWATLSNEALQAAHHDARVDHRSLEAQGIEREPTVHLGPAVSGMQRRGMETEVGRRLEAEVRERLAIAAELGRLEREAAAVAQSIVTLSTDIHAALAARDAERAKAQGARQAPADDSTPSLEQLRQTARERWLAYREAQQDRGGEPASGLDRSKGSDHDRGQALGPDDDPDSGPTKGKGRTPDDDFSL